MCEFCGCEFAESLKKPAQKKRERGKSIRVDIIAAAAEPKAHPIPAGSNQNLRAAPERAAVKDTVSTEA